MSRFLLPADCVRTLGTEIPACTLAEAHAYTRWLARRHHENFHLASFLLPRALHQDFYNIYAFCRWADDLADEFESSERSLELLHWWNSELNAMYAGQPRHPVYVALAGTVERRAIPRQPFADLLSAFVRDQRQTRYESMEDLLDYCRCSANPVGELVLRVCGYTDGERVGLSNATCTALQLANFWQDVRRDWEKGRVYIPLDSMARHGYSVRDLEQDAQKGSASENFRLLMRDLVDSTEELFEKGLPLVGKVDRRLAVDLDLFSRGGLAILKRIRRQDYDVFFRRPRLGAFDRARLLVGAAARLLEGGSPEAARSRRTA